MTQNTTIIQELINLACQYDKYTMYIDNYRQQLQAEKRNEEIEKEFIELAATIGLTVTKSDFFCITTPSHGCSTSDSVTKFLTDNGYIKKEDDSMATTTTTTVNETEIIKEETTMKKTNVHATDYMSKDKIREELKALGVELSNSKFKNTKRDALLEILEAKKAEAAPVTDTDKPAMPIAPVSAGVSVGDLPGTMDNAPSNDISKESEVLPETVAETVYQFTRAQCTQVLGRILMDSTAQEVFGTVSDYILHSHVAKVLFNKTMNVVKNGKFTKEKTVFSDTETAAINEFIHKLCAHGYITLNESGKSYSLSDEIKNKKGVWKHEPTGTEYIVDYKTGRFAKRGSTTIYNLRDKTNGKKLNRYVLQDTCVFQGFVKGGDK